MNTVTTALIIMDTGTIPEPRGKLTKNKGKFGGNQIQLYNIALNLQCEIRVPVLKLAICYDSNDV